MVHSLRNATQLSWRKKKNPSHGLVVSKSTFVDFLILFHIGRFNKDFVEKALVLFPRLLNCGGFKLFRAKDGGTSRPIEEVGTMWYHVRTLKKKNVSGKGLIYVRPLQRDLDLSKQTVQELILLFFALLAYNLTQWYWLALSALWQFILVSTSCLRLDLGQDQDTRGNVWNIVW